MMKNWMKSSFFWTNKNIKVKPIESYNSKERRQADRILFLIFIWDWFKNIFTMIDHFIKYGLIIPINDNKAETILTA